MQRLLNIMAFDKVIPLDAATSFELSEACWEVITKSNNFFGEGKGYIVGIKEIDANDKYNYGIYGVVKCERNFAISYRMFNRDGSPCGTTVYWTSLNGGTLCHGTNSFMRFKLPIIFIPTMVVIFSFESLVGRGTTARVIFGGTEPTLEEKRRLLQLIADRGNLHFSISIFEEDSPHYVLHGARERFVPASKFLKQLLKGVYNPKTFVERKVKRIEYLGKSGKTFSVRCGRDSAIGVYKVTYTDGFKEYRRAITYDIDNLPFSFNKLHLK